MFNDYRTILFMLGLLPSVIVNLSTSYSKDPAGRTIPGSEYQLESPLFDRHQMVEEDEGNNLVLDDDDTDDHRYQLIGASSQRPNRPGTSEFITRKNFKQSNWLGKLFGKGYKNKRVAFEQDSFPKEKDVVGDKMVPMASSSNDDYRSGHYFDSYGDWHHHGGSGGNGAGTGDVGDNPAGTHYHHPVSTTTHGHGYSLAGLNLLNPLILVATLSFIISLINAVLGVVDKIRLPVVRARDGSSTVGLSRLMDDGFLDELEDLFDGIHEDQRKSSKMFV